jgi:hypothetical protein
VECPLGGAGEAANRFADKALPLTISQLCGWHLAKILLDIWPTKKLRNGKPNSGSELMDKMHKGIRTLGVVAAFLAGVWASGASADIPSDVTGALSAPTAAAKTAALSNLGTANAGNLSVFTQIAQLVASGVTGTGASGAAGPLAAACGTVPDNAAITRVLVSTFVQSHSGAAGDIYAAIVGAGCSTEVAAATLQSSLSTAAGQALSLVPTLPANNPGTGVNLLQEAFVKSLNTTRLGHVEGFTPTGATPQSATDPRECTFEC